MISIDLSRGNLWNIYSKIFLFTVILKTMKVGPHFFTLAGKINK